ncbi:MAG: thiamine phosphate synthase [Verrucomicrobiae bacterium]|nr:thiamine phosphate synthase [Verrucomicrobiae bacterium]MCP5522376.1 thiamine phosphate synthase [Verrucomicrobiales bacterium]
MKTLAEARLYAFVDTGYLGGRRPADLAASLCAGGADVIQLRAKDHSRADVAAMARQILPVTRAAGVPLVVNDYLDVALEVGAEVCHLGQEDFFDAGHTHVSQLPLAGQRIRIGLSSHAPDQAERAVLAGADYVAIGPVFATPTKPGRPPVTLDYVRWAARHLTVPWFAIGGITLENLDDVLATGARRICVVSAILKAADVAGACQAFRHRLASAPRSVA